VLILSESVELDEESKAELYEAFVDLQEEASECLNDLLASWDEKGIHSLFRTYHNIKGNAGMMGLHSIVDFAHHVEDVAGALRQERYPLSTQVGDALMLALDRLHDLHCFELQGKPCDSEQILTLQALFQRLSVAEPDQVNKIAEDILSHAVQKGSSEDNASVTNDGSEISGVLVTIEQDKVQADLSFFQELALQLDNLIPGWDGRSIQLYDWAMKMNKIAGSTIDTTQFAAAIYMHDFGMSLLPTEVRENQGDDDDESFGQLRLHPGWAHDILIRMSGWEEAAQMVLQHHEKMDGTGYPFGIKGEHIHAGAKIIAILDAFFEKTQGFVTHENRAETVKALSDINAKIDSDFEGMWVQCFNHMIRIELKAGNV
jgi:HPt (histidine-containing phosphotransfer) domain-containing protein